MQKKNIFKTLFRIFLSERGQVIFVVLFIILIPTTGKSAESTLIYSGCDRDKLDYNGDGEIIYDRDDRYTFKKYWLTESLEADINNDEKINDYDLNCYYEAHNLLYNEYSKSSSWKG